MKNLSLRILKQQTFLFFLLAFGIISSCINSNLKQEVVLPPDPLPSWTNNETKTSIIEFIEEVTNKDSPDFIPVTNRIATFDNDGTLWSEQPVYFQFFFAVDRIKEMAPEHPEWNTTQPFKAILENNMQEIMQQGMEGLVKLVMTTHAGMTTDEFETIVKDWIKTAKHPQKNELYTDLIFQPMLELVDYLKSKDFKVFIVSGGGIEFIRAWSEEVYGIPKEQVVGTSNKTAYDYNNGNPVIRKLAELEFIDDKEGKPIGINKYIGKKPVFAAGNSDGDLQMLRWTDSNTYKSFKLYVHHTDSVREWAYDRDSHIGKFDKGLDEAKEKKWIIADMAKDWKVIYPDKN